MITTVVFNIQRFCVHDGPGIRTTVFLKGCNLNCRWCHNPESIDGRTQIQYFPEKCVECGLCCAPCPRGMKVEGKKRVLEGECALCGACTQMCMYDAVKLTGKRMSVDEVMDIVRKDKGYYDNSGGGLTVSGGEPLLRPDFCAGLFARARQEGISTAIDTAANVPYSSFEKVLPYTDYVLLDLKMMDERLHMEYTGVSNRRILENARRLFQENVELYIRIPVVAGVNDTIENAKDTARLLGGVGNISEIKLLPYHSMGEDKAHSVGRGHEGFAAPGQEQLAALAAEFKGNVVF